jgi:hypothetical protein
VASAWYAHTYGVWRLRGATATAMRQIPLMAFSWGALYVIAMAVETVEVKRAISSLRLSTWSLVLYNNILALGVSPLGTWLTTGHVLDSGGWATLVASPSTQYKVRAVSCSAGP